MSEEDEIEMVREKLREYRDLLEECYFIISGEVEGEVRDDLLKKLCVLGFGSSVVAAANTTGSGGV